MNDDFLDRLALGASPVKRVGVRRFAGYIAIGALTSIALIVGMQGMRHDIAIAASNPIFIWKVAAMALVAILSIPILASAGRPGASVVSIRLPIVAGLTALGVPLIYAIVSEPLSVLVNGLEAARGLVCLNWTSIATMPVWLASLAWLRQSAPTNLSRASWAAGLTSASVGATFFALHCPYDDIVYVAVWYGASITLIAAASRIVLPRLIRW